MIELQVLNKLLNEKTMKPLFEYNLTEEHFVTYKDEFTFILEHHRKYKTLPDKETLIDEFPDFDFVTVNETWDYLYETISEQYTYNKTVPVVHKIAELVQGDANKAVDYMKQQAQVLNTLNHRVKKGCDIVKDVDKRVDEYKFRTEVGGLLGISTGLKDVDKSLFGWLPEDLILILGRSNEGKTWIMLFFLVQAWMQGKKVLLYSGEMSHDIVGFRFDTLFKHFSNTGLMSGDATEFKPYVDYAAKLKEYENSFIVITPKDLGGKRLDTQMLDTLIETLQPDIVGIDQLTIMQDYRAKKGDSKAERFVHISEDLFDLTEKWQIPIMSPTQARRNNKAKDDEDTPSGDDVYGSDGPLQNSTRLIAIKQVPVGIKMTVEKNRYGPKNQEWIYHWDIDRGKITDAPVAVRKEKDVEYTDGDEVF